MNKITQTALMAHVIEFVASKHTTYKGLVFFRCNKTEKRGKNRRDKVKLSSVRGFFIPH